MSVRELLEYSGLSQAAFARKYGIPLRTLEDWLAGRRNPPSYVPQLLERVVKEDFRKGGKHDEKRTKDA